MMSGCWTADVTDLADLPPMINLYGLIRQGIFLLKILGKQ